MTQFSNRSDGLAGVVILAGGASKRMGTPKATLTLPTGERLIDYHVRHVGDLQVPILIADNGRGFQVDSSITLDKLSSPIVHVADYDADVRSNEPIKTANANETSNQINTGGALVAIESALQLLLGVNHSDGSKNQNASWLLVMSCDSLIPATDLWQVLQQSMYEAPDKRIICLEDDNHSYPLLGLYHLSIEPDLKAYIDSDQRRVMPFIRPIKHCVPFSQEWQHLTNFNTPKDFKQACAALPK